MTVRLLAGLRERAGTRHIDVEVPDGATVGEPLGALRHTPVGEIAPRRGSWR